jgi:hypothetical protein
MPKDTVPKQRSIRLAAAVAPRVADSPDEQLLIANYAKMDDRAREMISRLAVAYARDFPRDWVTLPADLHEAQPEAGAQAAGGGRGTPNLDATLDGIADDSDDIDCSLSLINDLLRVALNECERAGDDASYVGTVIRAARRYTEDISESNLHLQGLVKVLDGSAV